MTDIPQVKSKVNSSITVENLYRKIGNGAIAWQTHQFSIDESQGMGRQYLSALNETLEPNCLYEIWSRIVWPQISGEINWSSPLLAYRNDCSLRLKMAKYL